MSSRWNPCLLGSALLLALAATPLAAQAVPELIYYKFDEGSGNLTANLAQPGVGSAFGSIIGHTLSPTGGQFGGSLVGVSNATGVNSVDTGWITNLGSGSWTIGFWINLIGNTIDVMYIFGDPTAGPVNGAFRCFANSQAGAGDVRIRGPMNDLGTLGGAIASGGRYVHFVYDAASQMSYAYVDGALNNTVPQTGGLSINGSATFKVAGFTGNSAQSLRNGVRMDEFRVYNRALSASEIQATWNVAPNPDLVADFQGTPTSGNAPLAVTFTDMSTSTAPGGVTSWAWDFENDGIVDSNLQNPSHTYPLPGRYSVALTIQDGVHPAVTRTKTDYIDVGLFSLSVTTTGAGDLTVTAAAPPVGTSQGFTFASTSIPSTVGGGPFLGLNLDPLIFLILTVPASPGDLFHWIPSPGLYPEVPFVWGPGVLSPFAGVTFDLVVVYVVGQQVYASVVDRVTI